MITNCSRLNFDLMLGCESQQSAIWVDEHFVALAGSQLSTWIRYFEDDESL